MNQRAFWAVFAVVQSIGATLALVLPNARPMHFPILLIGLAFPLTVVCLFPGILISSWLLDTLRLPSTDAAFISVAIFLNAVIWFGVVFMVFRIRGRVASRA